MDEICSGTWSVSDLYVSTHSVSGPRFLECFGNPFFIVELVKLRYILHVFKRHLYFVTPQGSFLLTCDGTLPSSLTSYRF